MIFGVVFFTFTWNGHGHKLSVWSSINVCLTWGGIPRRSINHDSTTSSRVVLIDVWVKNKPQITKVNVRFASNFRFNIYHQSNVLIEHFTIRSHVVMFQGLIVSYFFTNLQTPRLLTLIIAFIDRKKKTIDDLSPSGQSSKSWINFTMSPI